MTTCPVRCNCCWCHHTHVHMLSLSDSPCQTGARGSTGSFVGVCVGVCVCVSAGRLCEQMPAACPPAATLKVPLVYRWENTLTHSESEKQKSRSDFQSVVLVVRVSSGVTALHHLLTALLIHLDVDLMELKGPVAPTRETAEFKDTVIQLISNKSTRPCF